MEESVAKKASELLMKKGNLSNIISKILDTDNVLHLAIDRRGTLCMYGPSKINCEFFRDDLVAFALKKFKAELDAVEEELNNLNCL